MGGNFIKDVKNAKNTILHQNYSVKYVLNVNMKNIVFLTLKKRAYN